ncbi:hypothetical protein KP509_05G088600 [Ceratopteris richardii]|uniref:Endonuclease/exonuclease/phosphatase domain-containing protein n=1 Tax=Ceratopteris richardii TaxID=49495 RepID=A0A8T2V0L6_CERRI|nr:hypothetical protein KP509_05G088600 [Ceratopteris richardii]
MWWDIDGRQPTGQTRDRVVGLEGQEELQPLLHIVRRDEDARYMWVRLRADTGRFLYITICYFPPSTSVYAAPIEQSPFSLLDDDIWEFSRDGDIILLGDFNARTGNSLTVFYDTSDEMLREMDVGEFGLERCSHDKQQREYGRYLIEMTTTHGLAILNGLHRFPRAAGFTCFPHRHGASTMDYIMTQPSFIPCIQDFTVGARPMGVAVDHALLTLSVSLQYSTAQTSVGKSHTCYTFTPETNSVYTKEIWDCLRTVGPCPSLEECTTLLTEPLHSAASVAYPHTRPVRRRQSGSMP